jgi:hypothetical protein
MQTTLRIKDHLYRRAKARSSELGLSLTHFFEEAVEERLERLERRNPRKVVLPVSSVSGLLMSHEDLKLKSAELDLADDLESLK